MLHQHLRKVVEEYPDELALADSSGSVNYVELWQKIEKLADVLTNAGVSSGDRICILSENSINAVCSFWAIVKCNAIAVFLNEQTPHEGLANVLVDADSSLIIASDKQYTNFSKSSVLKPWLKQLSTIDNLLEAGYKLPAQLDKLHFSQPDKENAIATIVYTSGSTGKPKGVCLTHRNLTAVAKMAGDDYQTVAEDRYLMVVPLHYIHGLMILMTMCLRAASIYFMNNFVFPGAVTKKLKELKITGFSGVPYHISALVDRGALLESELPHLRWIGITGGSCSVELLKKIRAHQPGINIHISYGMTECSPRVSALNPGKLDHKYNSVGCAAEGVSVEFLDDNGNSVATGQEGELVVSGPNIMYGYWQDPEATALVIDEQGRLHTGDYAYIDDEGDIFIKGRIQAMIKTAGERIFPEELESVLNSCNLVKDVAVVGVADTLYGQRVEAHLVLVDDKQQTLEDVKAYCLKHVAFARSPKIYHRWTAFPLKANGKIDRKKLEQLVVNHSNNDIRSVTG